MIGASESFVRKDQNLKVKAANSRDKQSTEVGWSEGEKGRRKRMKSNRLGKCLREVQTNDTTRCEKSRKGWKTGANRK